MASTGPCEYVVIFGRPGSGKSSLAEALGEDFGYRLIRTGEMLRAAIRRNDFLGRRVESHLAQGELVPDALILELLEHNLQAPGSHRLLFDGFPRTMGQVPLLEKFEEKLGFRVDGYLDVEVTREEAIARMTGRRVCPTCGATYHLITKPPRTPEACDNDGTRLERRPDDKTAVVEHRQMVYEEHALPILEYYRKRCPELCRVVDGNQSPSAVYAATKKALGLES
ncbi:adenylate kinase family protein [Tundrisphaera sp. TA3]|uniref:adenylate kinase family protein n=1 Tax=Tundrisphaera sp. TA3 TaxID=3435775 RepID=UPI003EBA1B1C